jgi:hypothetical protein
MVVNGSHVILYVLMTEHHLKAATYWTGDHGAVYMVQTETAYDGCLADDDTCANLCGTSKQIANGQATKNAYCKVSGSAVGATSATFSGFETAHGVKDLQAYGVNIYAFYTMAGEHDAPASGISPGAHDNGLGSIYIGGDVSEIKMMNASTWELTCGAPYAGCSKGLPEYDIATKDGSTHGGATAADQSGKKTFSSLQKGQFQNVHVGGML